ncbi:MAG: hypothetical protein LBS53_09855 [Synergistaceae bacterium]|jgi:uroporphyrinogen decarboxylase|nr:hypothetical protein [Synergistaceae bacterium]
MDERKNCGGREIVLSAISHKESRRLPIDFGATRATGITLDAYLNLARYLGVDDIPKVFDMKLSICEIGEGIERFFKPDAIGVFRMIPSLDLSNRTYKVLETPNGKAMAPSDFEPKPDGRGGFVLMNSSGVIYAAKPESSPYFDINVYSPLSEYETIEEMSEFDFDYFKMSDEEVECIAGRCVKAYGTGKSVVLNIWSNVLERASAVRGMEKFLMDLAVEEGIEEYIMENILERYLYNFGKILPRVRNCADIIALSDDMGTQKSLIISPEMYRRQIKPRHRRLIEAIKSTTGMKVFFHSCGAIEPLIGDLIEIGVDIINPVQFVASGMELPHLKETFGKDITFWGGTCDSQHVLPYGTPEEVYDQTSRNVEILREGGGFVFCPLHNIQHDVPPRNIAALFKAAGVDLGL